MELVTINKLYLELSQFATAKIENEFQLERLLRTAEAELEQVLVDKEALAKDWMDVKAERDELLGALLFLWRNSEQFKYVTNVLLPDGFPCSDHARILLRHIERYAETKGTEHETDGIDSATDS